MAAAAIAWTAETLRPDNLQRLERLPMSADRELMYFVHASPRDPDEWQYLFPGWSGVDQFEALRHPFCFIGHTHAPCVVAESGNRPSIGDNPIAFAADDRYISNVGSVGQPRDGDSRACTAVFDSEARTLTYTRLEYDIAAAAEKILGAGLPAYLAERLYHGR
jgi:diadenosine tetraphosphatase ApaH/serine/threonine PP2A family protein phosphatase